MFKKKREIEENLVLYNIGRLDGMMQDIIEAHDEKVKHGHSFYHSHKYESIIYTIDFIKREIERNYNESAYLKCAYCDKHFDGWGAYKEMVKHEVKEHEEQVELFNAVALGAFIGIARKALEAIESGITKTY